MKIKRFLSQSPVFALYRGNALIIEPLQVRFAKEGIHLLQGLLLTAFFFEDRDLRPLELANVFQISKSNLSHSLRSLEKKGFIKRSMHPEDARGYLFSLTASGRKKALFLVKEFDDIENKIEKGMNAKISKDFATTTNHLIAAYQQNFRD